MNPTNDRLSGARVGVVGAGRVGTALSVALREAGLEVVGPAGRGAVPSGCDAIVLCVPDAEIPAAAAAVSGAAPLVGHTSGATSLSALAPAGGSGFGLHPLQTFAGPAADGRDAFAGAGCAVAGTSADALAFAIALARALGMTPFEIDDEGRAAYHAAASIASNFLVTLVAAAESIAAGAGLDPHEARALLVPLLQRTVDNLAQHGPAEALTGPVARGDEDTVRAQRGAVGEVAPHLLDLFDELVRHTRALAAGADRPAGLAAGAAARADRPDARAASACPAAQAPRLTVVRSVAALRDALAPARRDGRTIGLVPTMGFFHDGHLSLMRRARQGCDVVVVSLFVNPAQFAPGEDLEAYPRDEARDLALAEAEHVDLVFAPSVEEVYPAGFDTTVSVGGLADVLEGEAGQRGTSHFGAVATVVTKLLNMAQPDVAYFGQKDAQQALVIRRLVSDLDIPVRIEVCPTVRDDDGLALSSRNTYLSAEERVRAVALSRALRAAETSVARGVLDAPAVLAAARSELHAAGIEPDYLELRSTTDLSPVERVNGSTLLAVAARVGKARLIDNTILGGSR